MLIQNHEPKTYVVLGMHRSGTSFLSKALADQGADMGNFDESVYESQDFLELNSRMLLRAGGTWTDPPSAVSLIPVFQENKAKIEELVSKNKGDKWGWKDPRTTITLPGYLPYLDGDVYLFCCFRKPSKVAGSIFKRNNIPIERGKDIAKTYNERLISNIQQFLSEDV